MDVEVGGDFGGDGGGDGDSSNAWCDCGDDGLLSLL